MERGPGPIGERTKSPPKGGVPNDWRSRPGENTSLLPPESSGTGAELVEDSPERRDLANAGAKLRKAGEKEAVAASIDAFVFLKNLATSPVKTTVDVVELIFDLGTFATEITRAKAETDRARADLAIARNRFDAWRSTRVKKIEAYSRD